MWISCRRCDGSGWQYAGSLTTVRERCRMCHGVGGWWVNPDSMEPPAVA